jgi:hypothetical protein
MPLDEASRHLVTLLDAELRSFGARDDARAERGEEVRFDSVSRMATWESRRGDVIGRWYGEVIASYSPKDRILRWSWAGRTSLAAPSHGEAMASEGQARGISQLAVSIVGDLEEIEAFTLVRLGLVLAKAQGVTVHRLDTEVRFVGLFDSPRPHEGSSESRRYSVPPPPVAPASLRPPPRPSAPPPAPRVPTLPPIREIFAPRSTPRNLPSSPPSADKKIREPARPLFVPVATAVLHALAKGAPHFQQALFVLSIADPEASRVASLTLVAVDAGGALRSVDVSIELVDAASRMIQADREDGNGPWKKLTARVVPKPDGGATLNVDVT